MSQVVEGAIGGLITLAKPESTALEQKRRKTEQDAASPRRSVARRRRRRRSVDRKRRISITGSVDGQTEVVTTRDVNVSVAEDAFVISLVVRALCNLSTVPQGCVTIIESGVVTQLRHLWNWISPDLQAAIGGHIVYNCTKSRGYAAKVADVGAVMILAEVSG